MYFDLMERKMSELIDKGYSEEKAYEIASNTAYYDLREDHLADLVDELKQRK